MPPHVRSQITNPTTLDEASRRRFAAALFGVHDQIFTGLDLEGFYRYVVDAPAQRTRIETYYGDDGRIVGYFAIHTFERRLEGRRVRVHRAETGLLPAYRGRALCARFFASQVGRALLAAPCQEHFFMGCLIHPSSHCGLSRHIDQIWPCPSRAIPPEIAGLMEALGDDFGLARIDGRSRLIRRIGWITRDPVEDEERWRTSEDPRVRLFVELNPDYTEGVGMLTLIPASFPIVLRAFSRNLVYKLRRRLDRRISGLLESFSE